MNKKKLTQGQKYLRKHKVTVAGKEAEAECWIKCIEVMHKGAVFCCGDECMELTDEQIRTELREKY